MSKLTEWSEPGAKPVHIGPYMVRERGSYFVNDSALSYWDGENWSLMAWEGRQIDPEKGWKEVLSRVHSYKGDYTCRPTHDWQFRGLAEDPNGEVK